jgi:TonB family protein
MIVGGIGCRQPAAPPISPRVPTPTPTAKPIAAPRPTEPPLTPHAALAKIETNYLGGLRRCYRARLKRDTRAHGRIVVTFTVDEGGRLASKRARGVGRALEACVERAMARWSFVPPVEETTFRLAFQLSSRS